MNKRLVLGLVENVSFAGTLKPKKVHARVDTGATQSSIDIRLAEELNLGPVITKKKVKSAHGIALRPVIKAEIVIKGVEIEEEFTIAERTHMTYPVLIGQNILKKGRFLVDPLK